MRFHLSDLTSLEQSVLLTISYTDQFEYPLTSDEVFERCLIGKSAKSGVKRVEKKSIDQAIHSLVEKHILDVKVDRKSERTLFFLSSHSSSVTKRLQREVWAKERDVDLEKVQAFCEAIPWVKAIFITGSLAMQSVDPEGDVDFMLIVQPKRLWLARILVSLFAQLHGKRRSWNHEEPASWCFNLWLDTDHLRVGESVQDVYRAHEVLQAKLLWERDSAGRRFFSENAWVKKFFLNKSAKFQVEKENANANDEFSLISQFLTKLDFLAFTLQSLYMRHHQTREKVGRGFAFFHPRDTKRLLLDGWRWSLQRSLSKSDAAEILEGYVK